MGGGHCEEKDLTPPFKKKNGSASSAVVQAQPHSISVGTVLMRGEQCDCPCALFEYEVSGVIPMPLAQTAVAMFL